MPEGRRRGNPFSYGDPERAYEQLDEASQTDPKQMKKKSPKSPKRQESIGDWIRRLMHEWRRGKKVGKTHPRNREHARQIAIAMAHSKVERGE